MLTREDLQAIEGLLDPRFDRLEIRMDGLEKRMAGLETRMDGLEIRMDGLETRMDGLETRMDGLEIHMDGLETRMDSMELKMEHMESDISAIRYNQLDMRREIRKNYGRIEDVYELALDNFGQIEESKTRLNMLEHERLQ